MDLKKILFIALPLLLALLFQEFFVGNHIGVNLPLFLLCVLVYMFFINPQKLGRMETLISSLLVVLSCAVLLMLHTGLSVFVCCFSFVVFSGFYLFSEIRAPLFSGTFALGNISLGIIEYTIQAVTMLPRSLKKPVTSRLKVMLLPGVVAVIFFSLYLNGSMGLNDIMVSFSDWCSCQIERIFELITPERISLFCSGLALVTGLVLKTRWGSLEYSENEKSDSLKRKRVPLENENIKPILRNEIRAGKYTLLMLNVILLITNCIDLNLVWFGFTPQKAGILSQFVHQGTYTLIVSILLSMVVLLYFFRGNLNFFSGNKSLKIIAGVWLLQNIFLAASVGMRNWRYVESFGLTHLRIGVFFFLLLTISCLIIAAIKIYYKKSFFYLFRMNCWMLLAAFSVLNLFHWDRVIVQHNLSAPNWKNIDFNYLLDFDPAAFPLVLEKANTGDKNEFPWEFNYVMKEKIDRYLQNESKENWYSWNLSDYESSKELERMKSW